METQGGSASSSGRRTSLREDRRRKRRSIEENQYNQWVATRALECLQSEATGVDAPPRIAGPRGLLGWFSGHDGESSLDSSQLQPSMVLLNVYDLAGSDILHKVNTVSTVNNCLLLGGFFHCGVELYSKEWCYGFAEEGSGIVQVDPRLHPCHKYRYTVALGTTEKSEDEVREALAKLSEEWQGCHYSTLHRNCLSFSNDFCNELGVRRIPSWLDRAPRVASFFDKALHSISDGACRSLHLARRATEPLLGATSTTVAQHEEVKADQSWNHEKATHHRDVNGNPKDSGCERDSPNKAADPTWSLWTNFFGDHPTETGPECTYQSSHQQPQEQAFLAEPGLKEHSDNTAEI